MALLLSNGYLVNPKDGKEGYFDILLENGYITKVVKRGQLNVSKDVDILDATGKVIMPGFIDLHVHLREPGFEYKETILSGTRACAKGGYTTVACMPNTNPVLDSTENIEKLLKIIESDACIDVLPIGAITKNIEGKIITDHKALYEIGAIGISDDGKTTMDATLMKIAFENAKKLGIPVITHSEDHDISEQFKETVYPLKAETTIVSRDIQLCEETNSRLHIAHISGAESIELVKKAKKRGVKVTCEAAPHHFALNDELVNVQDTSAKVNPPIRDKENQLAVIQGIIDGTIDIIATDHAPHDTESKLKPYAEAAYGISGIESAFSVSYSTLVKTKKISLMRFVEMLASKPAEIANLDKVGSVERGYKGNVTIVDLEKEITIDSQEFLSKGKNTPFNGKIYNGEVVMTLYNGNVVYQKNGGQMYAD